MSDKKEFDALLALLGERDLSADESARMWELIEKKEERLDEYLAAQQMNFALEDLNFSLVSEKQNEKIELKPKKNYTAIVTLAASVIIAGLIFWLTGKENKVETAQAEAAASVKKKVTDPLQEEYQKKIGEIPQGGSLNRPPTEFTSVGGNENKIDFAKDIQPILAENCISCHGPDAKHREADLRLDTYEGLLAEDTVVPGKPEKSELIARIFTDDEDDIMPPPDSHKELTKDQKDLLKRWIQEGAPWQKHWAFVKAQRPKVLKSKEYENPVDYFITKKLKSAGLQMNEPADRYELARRAAFDLTGLPPRPELLSSFILDRKEGAYERYIDKLLSSPQYGEHMARYWLDAARYGDTHGMHLDNYREIWPYRDWVINAFNSNMPFDKFTIDQIAGDLLPDATEDQLIATGFNRCNVSTSEGGSIPEEVAVRYMIDRVETSSTVFLGLTTGCAACHDHKFDPVSQQEFYQLGAFFNNTTQPAMDGNQKDSPPVLALPEDKFKEEWQQLLELRKTARRTVENIKGYKELVSRWWSKAKDSSLNAKLSSEKLIFELLGDKGSIINGKPLSLNIPEENTPDPMHPAGKEAGIRFTGKSPIVIDHQIDLSTEEPFTLSMWVRSPDIVKDMTVLEIGDKNHFLKLKLDYQGGIKVDFHTPGGKLHGRLPADMPLKTRSWQHLVIRYSGGQSTISLRIAMDGEEKVLRNNNQFLKPALLKGSIKLGSDFKTGGLSHVRFYKRMLSQNEVALESKEFEFQRSFTADKIYSWKDLNDDKRALLELYHQTKINGDMMKAAEVLSQSQKRRDYIYSRSKTTLIMEEKSNSVPTAYVLDRGEYDKKKERVSPDVPKVFPPMSADLPKNRLGLAHWIVSPENPLTARVTVNRIWQNLFGTGLVKTSEDFGIMGSQPTHPELLDWLALEFVESGWNTQHILRKILTSKAYRQSGKASKTALAKDPDNKLISRGPRFRLDAEELRDQALLVSGLLKQDIGGASVKPYQPKGLWKVVAFAGSNTKDFKADTGDKLYRRSLYTFWKRTSPPPSMAAFDAPTRENCTVRRERTNTPLQALVLMNDTQFVEAARYLAQRSLKEKSVELERLQWLFHTVLGKPASDEDIEDLSDAVTKFRMHFTESPKVAENLVKTGDSPVDSDLDKQELASWTMVVNILMNRDDFINN